MTNTLYIIRRALLILCMMATTTMAWAEVSVSNAEELASALSSSETSIKLTSNITLNATLTISRGIRLDLDGHNISATNVRAFHITSGEVTITSATPATISAGGSIADNSSVIRVGDNSGSTGRAVSLTIDENITIATDKCYGITVFGSATKETLIVNGHVTTKDVPAISGNGSSGYDGTSITIGEKAEITTDNDVAIYHPQSGTLTVNGTVRGAGGIEMKGGELVVGDKAKITATVAPSHIENNDGTSTKGYAISIVENGQYAGVSTISVSSNATITGAVAMVKDSEKANPETPDPSFTGGMQMNIKVTDGSSNVTGQYLYLEDAIREATTGSTITLLRDCNIKTTLETSMDFTLDLGGHTLTSNGQGALWIKQGAVTISSTSGAGRITVPTISDHDASVIRVGSEESGAASLIVEQNVTVSADECYGISVYGTGTTKSLTVSGNVETKIRPAIAGRNEAGSTTITIASTANITTTDEVAIYHPQDGTLTVSGTVTGAGGIEIKGGTLVVAAGAHVSATGTPTHVANDNGTSSRGYSIAIVENNACAGVTAVTVPDDATITWPMALLQDSEITDFHLTLTGSRLTAVASIEKDKYFTLKDAIDIVPHSGTVKLLKDLPLSETLAMDKQKTYTLDLAGYTLTGNNCPAIHVKYGNVTIANTGSEQSITVSDTPAAVILLGDTEGANRNVSLTINNNVNVNGRTISSGIKLDGSATRESLTVKGKVTTDGHIAILGTKGDVTDKIEIASGATVTATGAVAIYHPQSGRLIVDASATVSGSGAIEMKGGDLTVYSGANITKTATLTAHNPQEDAPSTDGYAIALVEHSGFPGAGKVNIDNGANIPGVIAWLVDSKNTSVAEPAFTGDVIMVAETDNASSLGERYAKISDAIEAAISGNEVRVLEDFAVTSPFNVNKAITLNMNDYTITGNQPEDYTITVSANATIKNGGIISDHGGISVTSGTVSLQDMTVKTAGVSLNVAGGTVTDNNSSSFTSTGDNTIALSAGSLQLSSKVYNTSSTANNNAVAASGTAALTVATTAAVSSSNGKGIDWGSNGALTIAGGKVTGTEAVNANNNGTVTINGGTFTGTGHAVNFGTCRPEVNHGTFICGSGESYKPIASTASGFVKGDYFSKAIDQTLCASGYMVSTTPKSNGMYYLVNEIVINDGTNWTPPATAFTIGTAKYVRSSGMGASGTRFGTLCLPFSFSSTQTGMTFYTVNRIEGNVLYLDAISSGVIAAGTPVVFQFTSAQTGFTIESTNATISASPAGNNDNKLFGTFSKTELTTSSSPVVGDVYYLNSDAFHRASNTLTVPAFRAYIKVTSTPAATHPRVLRIATNDDMSTAIATPLDDAAPKSVYDINGRKQNGLQRGLNIMRRADGSTIKVIVR